MDYYANCKWFLSATLGGEKVEREVTREEWIHAERRAGFHQIAPFYSNSSTNPLQPATGGWSSGDLSGRIEHPKP